MTALPNATVPLVSPQGYPGDVLRAVVPSLAATDQVVDENGAATLVLRTRLQALGAKLPNPTAALVNRDGTPTRVFTHLLASLA